MFESSIVVQCRQYSTCMCQLIESACASHNDRPVHVLATLAVLPSYTTPSHHLTTTSTPMLASASAACFNTLRAYLLPTCYVSSPAASKCTVHTIDITTETTPGMRAPWLQDAVYPAADQRRPRGRGSYSVSCQHVDTALLALHC